jgi:hypothetical protein
MEKFNLTCSDFSKHLEFKCCSSCHDNDENYMSEREYKVDDYKILFIYCCGFYALSIDHYKLIKEKIDIEV